MEMHHHDLQIIKNLIADSLSLQHKEIKAGIRKLKKAIRETEDLMIVTKKASIEDIYKLVEENEDLRNTMNMIIDYREKLAKEEEDELKSESSESRPE